MRPPPPDPAQWDSLLRFAIVAVHRAGGVFTYTRAEYNAALASHAAKPGDGAWISTIPDPDQPDTLQVRVLSDSEFAPA